MSLFRIHTCIFSQDRYKVLLHVIHSTGSIFIDNPKRLLIFLEGTLWFSFERELEWKRNPRNSLLISSILEVLLTLSLSHSHSHHLNLGHNSMPTLQNPEWVVVLAGANAYKLCDTDCSYCDTYWSFSVTLYIYFFYQLCYYEKKKRSRICVIQYYCCFNNM